MIKMISEVDLTTTIGTTLTIGVMMVMATTTGGEMMMGHSQCQTLLLKVSLCAVVSCVLKDADSGLWHVFPHPFKSRSGVGNWGLALGLQLVHFVVGYTA